MALNLRQWKLVKILWNLCNSENLNNNKCTIHILFYAIYIFIHICILNPILIIVNRTHANIHSHSIMTLLLIISLLTFIKKLQQQVFLYKSEEMSYDNNNNYYYYYMGVLNLLYLWDHFFCFSWIFLVLVRFMPSQYDWLHFV